MGIWLRFPKLSIWSIRDHLGKFGNDMLKVGQKGETGVTSKGALREY